MPTAVNQFQNLMRALKNPDQVDQKDPEQAQALQQSQDMQNAAMNVGMGSMQIPEGAIPELSLADRIKMAAQKSGVKQVPTFEQAANEALYNKNVPKNFFDNAAQTASENGVGASPMEAQQFAAQKQATQNMIDQRNINQLQAARFKAIKGKLGGSGE